MGESVGEDAVAAERGVWCGEGVWHCFWSAGVGYAEMS